MTREEAKNTTIYNSKKAEPYKTVWKSISESISSCRFFCIVSLNENDLLLCHNHFSALGYSTRIDDQNLFVSWK